MSAGIILVLAAVLFPVAVRGTVALMNHLHTRNGNIVHPTQR